MTAFYDVLLNRIKSIINGWDEDGIYAISFFVNNNEAFEYNGFTNISTFAISYNTEKDCSEAGQYDEERWNYAFWRQNESMIIDPDDPDSLIGPLFAWYKENNIQNIGYEDNENCYDADYNYIGKGPVGHYELLSLISDIAKQLQTEGFIKNQFHKDVPIIIHGLEYAWYDLEATTNANPNGEAEIFLEAMQKIRTCNDNKSQNTSAGRSERKGISFFKRRKRSKAERKEEK